MNTEYDEIARMLPEPGDPELSPLRHRQLKEHLMRESTARPRRRIRLVALLAPVAAGTAALALAVPALLGAGSHQENVAYVPAPIIRVPAVSRAKVAPTLARIADAAARGPAVAAGPHRYTYTKSMVESTQPMEQRTIGGPVEMIALHVRESWIPLDPSKETGLSRESGQETTLHSAIDALGYRQLAALPTDPAALLDRLYARQGDRDPGRAFDQIQTLMSEVAVPPATRAALYRATALIPGVRVVSDSQDALGRKGVAVAFDKAGERTEWVFDKTSFAYLGDRDYLIADSDQGKAGTLMSADAIQTQAVVDGKGRRP